MKKGYMERNITQENKLAALTRQYNKCLGCRKDLTSRTACVDYNTITGIVRGILCCNCASTLEKTKENPATLRRLMAYLAYDRTKTSVYIIGSLRNPQIPKVAKVLRDEGYDAYDEWHSAGEFADQAWMDYEVARGRSYVEALKGRAAQNVFHFDVSHLDLSDYAVLVAPAGRSGHLELGYFHGCGKPAFVLLDGEPDRYDVMPNFVTAVCPDIESLIVELAKLKKKEKVSA